MHRQRADGKQRYSAVGCMREATTILTCAGCRASKGCIEGFDASQFRCDGGRLRTRILTVDVAQCCIKGWVGLVPVPVRVSSSCSALTRALPAGVYTMPAVKTFAEAVSVPLVSM